MITKSRYGIVMNTEPLAQKREYPPARNPALTGIRGFAALAVAIYHTAFCASVLLPEFVPSHTTIPLLKRGYLGVDLFFFLSGIVLTMNYAERMTSRNPAAIRNFAFNRITRILPLHWVLMGCLAAMYPFMAGDWLVGEDRHTLPQFIATLFLVQTWLGMHTPWIGPAWSLSAEWLMYCLFPFLIPLVMRVSSRRTSAFLAIVVLIGFIGGSPALGVDNLTGTTYAGIARCIFEFTAGVLIYRAVALGPPISSRTGFWIFMAGIVLLIALIPSRVPDFVALPAFALVLIGCLSQARLPQAIFGNRTAAFLGEISYSIYLVNVVVLEAIYGLCRQWPVADQPAIAALMLAAPFLNVLLAWGTWRWIELPGQKAGKAFARRMHWNQ